MLPSSEWYRQFQLYLWIIPLQRDMCETGRLNYLLGGNSFHWFYWKPEQLTKTGVLYFRQVKLVETNSALELYSIYKSSLNLADLNKFYLQRIFLFFTLGALGISTQVAPGLSNEAAFQESRLRSVYFFKE